MKQLVKNSIFGAAFVAALVAARPALAQDASGDAQDSSEEPRSDAATSEFTISGNVGFFTDYRFRGISLNDGRETIQGIININHESGLYVSAWGSGFAGVQGDSSEIAVYTGVQRKLGGIGVNVGVVNYLFPGDSELNFLEVYGSATAQIGPVSQTVGVYYAPDQNTTALILPSTGLTEDSVYYYSTTSFPISVPELPVTLSATVGYERGARLLSEGGKVDWDLSATVRKFGLDWSVHYIGSDSPSVLSYTGENISGEAVVASITRSF